MVAARASRWTAWALIFCQALGEPYAKTSIGAPFTDLSVSEEELAAIALRKSQRCWMRKEPIA